MATYSVKACLHCGKRFQPNASHTKHCSPLCRFKWIASQFSVDGCWEWPLSVNKQTGYGQFTMRPAPDQIVRATHRLSYETFVGPIQDGMCIMHTCDNRRCFNPKHLRQGTLSDNNRDMVAKGRHWSAKAQPVTVCLRGHDKKLMAHGRWKCLPCESLRKRLARQTTSRNRTPAQ